MAKSGKLVLDNLDISILTYLEEDGRKSFSDIAENLQVSLSTISNRVKRLIEDEILTVQGFLDPHKVGFNVPAYILISVYPSLIESAAEEIAEFPEVLSLTMLTGEYGLAAEVHCRDTNHLTNLLVDRLQHVEGVREIRTSIQLRDIGIKQPSVEMLLDRHPT